MKKLLALVITLAMTLSLVACGGSEEPTSSTAPSSSEAEISFTADQQALAQEYLDMCTKYDEAVDKVNNNPTLLANTELVDTMNELAQSIIEADEHFANPEELTDEIMTKLKTAFEQTYAFIEQVNKLADTVTEQDTAEAIVVAVEVINNTGVEIHGLAMSPANNENWGENLLTAPLADGKSGVTQMSFTEDTLVWDLLVEDVEGNQLSFMGIDFSEANIEGAKLVLAATEGGDYMAMFVE